MSNTIQVIHIASEIVIIGGITTYFINKTNKLHDRIEELESKIQQQDEIIQQHDTVILKLLNNVNFLIEHNREQQKTNQFISVKKKQEPQILNSSKKVIIMVPEKIKQVEEIIDESCIIDDLDSELEEELKELELEQTTKNNFLTTIKEEEEEDF